MDKNNLPKNLFEPLVKKEDMSDRISTPSRTFGQNARRTLFKNKLAMISLFILLCFGVLSLVGPGMNEYGYNDQDLNRAKMPPHVEALKDISWLGFNGTLSGKYEGKTVEAAIAKAVLRYENQEDFIDIKVINEGNGSDIPAKIKATYHIYEAKEMQDTYFWLGTDNLGRDQWTRLWEGTQISLLIAIVAAAIDLVIGVAYGGISAFYGGRVDTVMQRIIEVLVGIPNLIVILLMVVILKPGILSIIVALTITGWIGMARLVRGEVLKLKSQEFVLAARTLGTVNLKIITKHLLPNISGIIIINTMFTIPSAIFFEAFLSFIGLGLAPPAASLGTLINGGFASLRSYPYLLLYPAIVISVIMIAFNLLADGLRDAFDPKMHK